MPPTFRRDVGSWRIAPLAREHSLARTLLPAHISPPGLDQIQALALGAPAVVEQLAGWLETGASSSDAPTILVDLVSARVGRLPAIARRVLQATAVR